MREIEKPLEELGVKWWSTGHEYCTEHPATHACYSPHWEFTFRGHEFIINKCHLQDKWVVWIGDVRHLVDTMDDAVALVANVEPRAEEEEEDA